VFECLNKTVYISRDVIFYEEVFPFAKLNTNAGARLRAKVTLLHPTLFPFNYGDNTVHNHINDIPLPTNTTFEYTGANSGKSSSKNLAKSSQIHGIKEANTLGTRTGAAPAIESSTGLAHQPEPDTTPLRDPNSTAVATPGFIPPTTHSPARASAPEASSSLVSSRACMGAPGPLVPSPANACLGSQPWEDGSSVDNLAASPHVVNSVPAEMVSTMTTSASTTAPAARLVTRAQKGIHQPCVYTDGNVRYGKHGFLTSNGEPRSVNDALANSN
jgi:hypothetical protein